MEVKVEKRSCRSFGLRPANYNSPLAGHLLTLMERITGRNIYFYNGYSSNAYNSVERYRSPVSGSSATTCFPLIGNCAKRVAADGSSQRCAHQQSLILRQFATRTDGVIIGYQQHFVYHGTVIVLRHKSGTIPRYFMGSGLPTGKYGRIFGLTQPQSLPLGYWLSRLHPHHSLRLPVPTPATKISTRPS